MRTILSLCGKGLMLAAIYMGACPGESPFPGGIRMEANEALFEAQSAKLPVEGVGDFGNLIQVIGPGNGNQLTFVGFTDFTGIDDHPYAQTNAYWTVTWDWTTSPIPACRINMRTGAANIAGAVFERTCLI